MLDILDPKLKECSLVFLSDIVKVMKDDGRSPFDIKDILKVYFFIKEQKMMGRSLDDIEKEKINEVIISDVALLLVEYNVGILDSSKDYQDYLKEYEG